MNEVYKFQPFLLIQPRKNWLVQFYKVPASAWRCFFSSLHIKQSLNENLKILLLKHSLCCWRPGSCFCPLTRPLASPWCVHQGCRGEHRDFPCSCWDFIQKHSYLPKRTAGCHSRVAKRHSNDLSPDWLVRLVADVEAPPLELDDVSFLQALQTRISQHLLLQLRERGGQEEELAETETGNSIHCTPTLLFLLMYSLKSSSLVMTALVMRGW